MSGSGTAVTAARAAAPLVQLMGESFMLQEETRAAGRELGYGGWPLYFAGRAGVLGPAPADVVTAAVAFFPPEFVRTQWAAALAVGPVQAAVDVYVAHCRRWGREHLRDAPGLGRFTALAERVIACAPRAGRPLFAGWADLPLPKEQAERAAQLLQVLREHRGSAHILAVLGSGIEPLTAVLADPASGPTIAEYFRWPPPYRAVSPAERSAWEAAERFTDRLVARDLLVLNAEEHRELVGLIRGVYGHAFGSVREHAN